MRRPGDRVGADRLGDAGRGAVEHRHRRFRGDVTRPEARSARRQDEPGSARQLGDRVGDRVALVRYHPPLDLVALAGQQLLEHVAAPVLARPLRDPVGHRQDGGPQTCSFVFSSSRTPSTVIPLSIAFAMS